MISEDVLTAAKTIGRQMRVREFSDEEFAEKVNDACQSFDVEADEEIVGQLGRWLGENIRAVEDETRYLIPFLEKLHAEIDKLLLDRPKG